MEHRKKRDGGRGVEKRENKVDEKDIIFYIA